MLRLALALVLAVAAPGLASAAGLAAGSYENTLMIGYDPATGQVTGYFNMVYPGPPVMSCIFAMEGKLAGAGVAIDAYDPDTPTEGRIKGSLAVEKGRTVAIKLADDPDGCTNVWSFADKDASVSEFVLDKAYPWIAVRSVKSDKAYIYPSAGAATHGRAYLVNLDGVGERSAKPGWVQIDYVGGKHAISGWVKDTDLYPAP